jgi:hypothetical protein
MGATKNIWELPDGICKLNPNPKKNDQNVKSAYQNKKQNSIKVCLVHLKRKRAKNLHESYPTEFAGSTQNPKKKLLERQIN